jgi:hypothetical protein
MFSRDLQGNLKVFTNGVSKKLLSLRETFPNIRYSVRVSIDMKMGTFGRVNIEEHPLFRTVGIESDPAEAVVLWIAVVFLRMWQLI